VFLAEVTDDLEEVRERIRLELKQHDVRVLPERALPSRDGELRSALLDDLSRSALSVHLVGPLYGRKPEGGDRSHVQVQMDLAAQVARANPLRRLVWMGRDLEPTRVSDERQRRFLLSIDAEQAPAGPVDVLKVSVEELKETILRAVVPERERSAHPEVLVYVISVPEDKPHALLLKEFLRALQYDVTGSLEGVDEQERERHHQVNLRYCDAVVIVHGAAPRDWVIARAREALGMAGRRRRQPLLAVALYAAGGTAESELGMAPDDLVVVEGQNGLRPEAFSRFFARLRSRGAASAP
jgi:hypothetical protein